MVKSVLIYTTDSLIGIELRLPVNYVASSFRFSKLFIFFIKNVVNIKGLVHSFQRNFLNLLQIFL